MHPELVEPTPRMEDVYLEAPSSHHMPAHKEVSWNHPKFMSFLMGFAMAFATPVFLLGVSIQQRSCGACRSELEKLANWKVQCTIAGMGACDIIGMWGIIYGLQYIPATLSVQQQVGGGLVMNTILSTYYLKQPLYRRQVVGIMIATLGSIAAMIPSLLHHQQHHHSSTPGSGFASSPLWVTVGSLATFGGTFLQVLENVGSEVLMKMKDLEPVPPVLLVGIEGTWAMLIFGVVYGLDYLTNISFNYHHPAMYSDVLLQKPKIEALLAACVFTTLTKNILSNYIILCLSSLWFAMLKVSRLCVIWALHLMLHYSSPTSGYGRAFHWAEASSWVELVSLMVVLIGVFLYSKDTSSSSEIGDK